jgi:AcrR family transcriptional regulator
MTGLNRRERAIAVTQQLALEGGWDGITMRAVSELSGSALATLYREFPSKTHLVLAMAEADVSVLPAPRVTTTRADAVADLLIAITRDAFARPSYVDSVLHAVLTAGADAAEAVTALRTRLSDALIRCWDAPTDDLRVRIDLLEDVWFAQLIATLRGRQTQDGCIALVRAAAHRLLL